MNTTGVSYIQTATHKCRLCNNDSNLSASRRKLCPPFQGNDWCHLESHPLLDTFNLINTQGDTIDEDELVNFLINLFPKESSMSAFYHLQVTLMIKTIDLDSDNTIDKYEWFELMVPIMEKEETESLAEEVFEKVFNILDYDGGGDITVSEFRDVLLKIGLNISYEEVREIINEHDDSGDGLMDLEEFVHMMKNQI